jgi:hypothetical protein
MQAVAGAWIDYTAPTIETSDNAGPRIDQMLANTGNAPGAPWCAAAVSTWFKEGAATLGTTVPFALSAGVIQIVQQFETPKNTQISWTSAADIQADPTIVQPGMIVAWSSSPGSSSLSHIGLVVAASTDGVTYQTIEGNSGPNSDRVALMTRQIHAPTLFGMGTVLDQGAVV